MATHPFLSVSTTDRLQHHKIVSNKFENINGFCQLRNLGIYDTNFCSDKFRTFH
jgi:hypothetical protein